MLKLRVERDGFPPGRMIGPNSRAWSEQEIDEWFKSRPIAGPEPRGAAKSRRGRKAGSAAAAPVGGANLGGSPDP
jgi:hypothetical protein